MALKSTDALVFKSLSSTLDMLMKMNPDIEAVKAVMKDNLSEFEVLSGHKVRFVQQDGVWQMTLVDTKRDFVRIRKPNEESKVLRTRINSVQIEVKLQKNDEYEFDNQWVAKSLRELADEVESAEQQLSVLDVCDIRKLASGESSDADVDADVDGDADAVQGENKLPDESERQRADVEEEEEEE